MRAEQLSPDTESIPVVDESNPVVRKARAQAKASNNQETRSVDILRLGFLACYVLSATMSQFAMAALTVYLIA